MNKLNEIFEDWRDTYSKATIASEVGINPDVMSKVVGGWLPLNAEDRRNLQEAICRAINERSERQYTVAEIWPDSAVEVTE